MLARLLGVPETQGIGIGLALWQWALEVANDGDFGGHVPDPALVSAACGWPLEDGQRLITELQRVGLVATAPVLRVRGLDRYRRAWEKNRRKNSKPLFSGDDVPETGANPRGTREEPARQNKTQKKNKNTEDKDMSDTASPVEPLALEIQEPAAPPRPTSEQLLDELTEDEFQVFQHWRLHCEHPKAVATKERKKLIAKWLKVYSVLELQRAIEGCAGSPFHRGVNDRQTRYDSLELILRDAQKIEGFKARRQGDAA